MSDGTADDVLWIEEPSSEQITISSSINYNEKDVGPTEQTVGVELERTGRPEAAAASQKPNEEQTEDEQIEASSSTQLSPRESISTTQVVSESATLDSVEPLRIQSDVEAKEKSYASTSPVVAEVQPEENQQPPPSLPPSKGVRFAEDETKVAELVPASNEVDSGIYVGNGTNNGEENNPPSTSETDLQLDEYERKLRQNTKEALELVDRLCEQQLVDGAARLKLGESSKQQQANNDNLNGTTAAESSAWNGGDALEADGNSLNIDSLCVNPNIMKEPIDCLMLPDRRVLILDNKCGLILLSLENKSITRAEVSNSWRNPQCATFINETKHILVLSECNMGNDDAAAASGDAVQSPTQPKDESVVQNGSAANPNSSSTTFDRYICRFDSNLQLVNKVEAPKFIRDKVVIGCRMCYMEQTKCLYLAVSTPSSGFLYELNANCRWSEVYNTRGHNFTDVQAFAVVGPITELLLVESNRSYVLLVSIYESQVVDRRMIAVSERPETISVDERGNLFVFDKATSHVGHHSRIYFEKLREVAVVNRAHCRISAGGGLVAVLSRQFRELKLYRYS